MRPGPHVQLGRNPLQRHARLGSQPSRNLNFPRVPFGPLGQLCCRPTQLVQFFLQEAPRLLLRRLPPRFGMVTFRGARVDARQ